MNFGLYYKSGRGVGPSGICYFFTFFSHNEHLSVAYREYICARQLAYTFSPSIVRCWCSRSQLAHVSQICFIRPIILVQIWIQTNLSPKLGNVRGQYMRCRNFPGRVRTPIRPHYGNGMLPGHPLGIPIRHSRQRPTNARHFGVSLEWRVFRPTVGKIRPQWRGFLQCSGPNKSIRDNGFWKS